MSDIDDQRSPIPRFPVPIAQRKVTLVTRGYWRRYGLLRIYPGIVVAELRGLSRRISRTQPVVHTAREIEVFTAKAIEPWRNVGVRLHDNAGAVIVVVSIATRKALVDELARAGFAVKMHSSWFRRGLDWSKLGG